MKRTLVLVLVAADGFMGSCEPSDTEGDRPGGWTETVSSDIRNGTPVTSGYAAAVSLGNASSPSCTGTLVTDTLVLTAAHCQVPSCTTAALGRAVQVNFQNAPLVGGGTGNASIQGKWSWRHPNECYGGLWQANDVALITLSRAASSVVAVAPLTVSTLAPGAGDFHDLIGFGGKGTRCSPNVTGTKRRGTLQVTEVQDRSPDPSGGQVIVYESNSIYICPGDSGGPSLGNGGTVVQGIASWSNQLSNSNYVPGASLWPWAGVMVCDLTDFGNCLQGYLAGRHDVGEMTRLPNDSISSMLVGPGLTVRLFAEAGFWGDQQDYTGNVSNVGSLMNNRTSSLEVLPGVTVYSEINFGGDKQTFTGGSFDVDKLSIVGNDRISSLIVGPGMKATLYVNPGIVGESQWFTGWVSNIGADMNDRTSSIKVEPL